MADDRIRPHFVRLSEQLNLAKLLPFLKQERMVTGDEYETLTNVAYTTREKRAKLLTILPRKGKYYFENFGKCLVWSGQVELARHIGVDVDSVPTAPYTPSPDAGSANDQAALLTAIKDLINSSSSDPPPYPPRPDIPSSYHPPPRANPPSYQPAPPGPPLTSVTAGKQPPQDRQYRKQVVVGGASAAVPQDTQHFAPGPSDCISLQHHVEKQPGPGIKVFILYCNDTMLQEQYRTTDKEFCQDVLELADTLVYCGGFQSCSADFYEIDEQQNWNVWTQRKIEESTCVVMVCSPQLMWHLSQKERSDVHMERGMFFSDTIVNTIMAPKFVPVFLNDCVPRNPKDWLPPQLHAARKFQLRHLRELFQALHAVDYTEEERNHVLLENLEKPEHKDLARLVVFLRGEKQVVRPEAPRNPIAIPRLKSPRDSPTRHVTAHTPIAMTPINSSVLAEIIPEAIFVKIAERLPRDWVRLGVKLGVSFSVLERLRYKHEPDHVPAALEMFGLWQILMAREATRKKLKQALVDINKGRIAGECFPDVKI